MPELPDVTIYVERLAALFGGRPLERLRVLGPSILRSVTPAPEDLAGATLQDVQRIGKRIVMAFEGDLFAVIHLMVGGRLRMREPGTAIPRKRGHAAFDFPNATILLTEDGTKKRASIHLVSGAEGLAEHRRGGLEPITSTLADFTEAITRERHTLKRALTDARLISGIGGAYADEIMHRARLGPLTRTDRLTDDDLRRLHEAAVSVLGEWTDRLRAEVGEGFPEKVTAFRPDMAVHGRYGLPCPVCTAPVQRISYAERETNYCARCQTGGTILADRSLSRLLKDDWPRSLEDLE